MDLLILIFELHAVNRVATCMAIGMLYIKINPYDVEMQWNILYHKIGMSGAPKGPLKETVGPIKGLWGACKLFICKFLTKTYVSLIILLMFHLINSLHQNLLCNFFFFT